MKIFKIELTNQYGFAINFDAHIVFDDVNSGIDCITLENNGHLSACLYNDDAREFLKLWEGMK